jgi:hypothetical protein
MKCCLIAFLCVLTALSVNAVEVSGRLLHALKMVESGCKSDAIGDNGNAVGVLQLHKVHVDDANRIIGYYKYTYNDRYDVRKSEEITLIVLAHYGDIYEYMTGKPCTDEVLARIHNRGYSQWNDKLGERYWNRVQKFLK